MTRPITLFTGQWADLPFEEVARLAAPDPRIRLVPPLDDHAGLMRMDGPLFGPILGQDRFDWLLFTDADEFWLTRTGRLADDAAPAHRRILRPVVGRWSASVSRSQAACRGLSFFLIIASRARESSRDMSAE